MHSKNKGSLGEIAVAKDLIKRNMSVFVEYGDNSKIDIITISEGNLISIQVKWIKVINGALRLTTLKSGPGYKYRYIKGDFDLYGIYCQETDKIFYVPLELVLNTKGSLTLRFDDLRTSSIKVRYLEDYESLDKAVAYIKASDVEKRNLYPTTTKRLIAKSKILCTRRFLTKEIAEKMLSMKHKDKKTNREIALHFGVVHTSVPRAIRKFKLEYTEKS